MRQRLKTLVETDGLRLIFRHMVPRTGEVIDGPEVLDPSSPGLAAALRKLGYELKRTGSSH